MPNEKHTSNSKYMYDTSANTVEEVRLAGLNSLHNPHTLSYLKPYFHNKNNLRVLEIACGGGYLAENVLDSHSRNISSFTGIDIDPAQVKLATHRLSKYHTVNIAKLDVLTELEQLEGPFDIIYCRWLLVHLPKDKIEEVLSAIFKLLSPENGVFLCDECDNRKVSFINRTEHRAPPQASIATKSWKNISKALMTHFGNDLELTPEKIGSYFDRAASRFHMSGKTTLEGQYQVTLETKEQKNLITLGYESSKEPLIQSLQAFNNKVDFLELMKPFYACREDEDIQIKFLLETVMSFQRS